jgi:hypothetical protein
MLYVPEKNKKDNGGRDKATATCWGEHAKHGKDNCQEKHAEELNTRAYKYTKPAIPLQVNHHHHHYYNINIW